MSAAVRPVRFRNPAQQRGVGTGSVDPKDAPNEWKSSFVSRHVFYVKGITPDGKIILGNPWSGGALDVVATPDQYEKYFNSPQELQVTG